jgi:hypothetical protein
LPKNLILAPAGAANPSATNYQSGPTKHQARPVRFRIHFD